MSLLEREPVRVYLGSIVAAVLALLVTKSIIDSSTSLAIGAVATAVLGFPAVEVARSKVTPVVDPEAVGEA